MAELVLVLVKEEWSQEDESIFKGVIIMIDWNINRREDNPWVEGLLGLKYLRPPHGHLAIPACPLTGTPVAVVRSRIVTDDSHCMRRAHHTGPPL